ncbi:metallophosphoesterase [Blastopirellula marina]|nr:metallophosphoesterase [Blastopirellula marina]
MQDQPELTGRLIAIGDIHGHAASLTKMLELIRPMPDDTIVTLGDYVNRGPDSCQVLEILTGLDKVCRYVAILGNHDEMMLACRYDPQAEERWFSKGGDLTLESYGPKAQVADIPEPHWEFLEACRPIFETEQFIFTHANYCWYSDLSEQPVRLLRWMAIEMEPPRPHVSGKTVIVAHSPGKIRDLGFCRCIDTGCSIGGVLTAMEVNSRKIWQVTESGEPIDIEAHR